MQCAHSRRKASAAPEMTADVQLAVLAGKHAPMHWGGPSWGGGGWRTKKNRKMARMAKKYYNTDEWEEVLSPVWK